MFLKFTIDENKDFLSSVKTVLLNDEDAKKLVEIEEDMPEGIKELSLPGAVMVSKNRFILVKYE